MRDPNRIQPVLDKVKVCWEKVPDWRFGQLVRNLQRYAGTDLFYMEDEEFLKLLDDYFDLDKVPEENTNQ